MSRFPGKVAFKAQIKKCVLAKSMEFLNIPFLKFIINSTSENASHFISFKVHYSVIII